MLDWITTFAGWLARAEVRAILIALVISWNATQLVKNAPWLMRKPEAERRLATRTLAFVLACVPCGLLWPPGIEGPLVAIAVGLASPVIYTVGARVLYHYFPWLEPKMSATPVRKAGE